MIRSTTRIAAAASTRKCRPLTGRNSNLALSEKARDLAVRANAMSAMGSIASLPLTGPARSRCANQTIDDAGPFIDELLTAHPDIAARDFLTHPGKPDIADAANADVVAE